MRYSLILLAAIQILLPTCWTLGQPSATAQEPARTIKGWQRGSGWGWIWGKDDEVGSLNAMTDQSKAAALRLAQQGQIYDLGITYSRQSYKWPGHSPGEIMSFRSPGGVDAQKDAVVDAKSNSSNTRWHS